MCIIIKSNNTHDSNNNYLRVVQAVNIVQNQHQPIEKSPQKKKNKKKQLQICKEKRIAGGKCDDVGRLTNRTETVRRITCIHTQTFHRSSYANVIYSLLIYLSKLYQLLSLLLLLLFLLMLVLLLLVLSLLLLLLLLRLLPLVIFLFLFVHWFSQRKSYLQAVAATVTTCIIINMFYCCCYLYFLVSVSQFLQKKKTCMHLSLKTVSHFLFPSPIPSAATSLTLSLFFSYISLSSF